MSFADGLLVESGLLVHVCDSPPDLAHQRTV